MKFRRILRLLGHQRWIRFGIRNRILHLFDEPDKTSAGTFKVAFYNKIYPGDFQNYIDRSTYYYGAYCGQELELMRDAVSMIKKPVILDIGANIGHHSLFASTIAESVHSFEPFPPVYRKLEEKIQVNQLGNVHLHKVGLGDKDLELSFSVPTTGNTGVGSFVDAKGSDLVLPIRAADPYIDSLNLHKIDFIKMDIEGFEPVALRGLARTLADKRPVVFFEWSANERKLDNNPRQLFPAGYRLFDFLTLEPLLGVFCRKHYRLREAAEQVGDGNKVAIPVEKLSQLQHRIFERS